MTSKYNIYRLKKELEKPLVDKLTSDSVGLKIISEKEVDGFRLRFFFSTKPDEVDIWWTKVYGDFFEDIEKKPKNQLYFGLLLISNKEICYAISLGKTHFYLKDFCDPDFGLELAQRIADETDSRIKNSKFYKSLKSKTITTYQKGSMLNYDSGESMHYLRAKTIDSLLWGKVASFGGSVQLALPITPLDLPEVIKRIESELSNTPRFEIPKADVIRDEQKIEELDKKLAKAIITTRDVSNLSIDEFSVSGVDFVFLDRNNHKLFVKGDQEAQEEVGEISIEKLVRFAQINNINLEKDLNSIYVYMHNEYGRGHSQPVKTVLDYIDEQERYCLIDGKWHKFNQSYLKFLTTQVDTIPFEYNSEWNISGKLDESDFNKARVKDGFSNLDKELTTLDGKYRWEKMDLYKDDTLYFVKKGVPQKLGYVIDQAINTVKLLQQHDNGMIVDGENLPVKTICLWLIFERKTPIEKLSELNSIIFHMKLVDWKKTVDNAGYKPLIKLNYLA
ncbi:MAG: TIGR04141 family sporadically distributed protein [Bacteroidia bacterium]|nr:TIGR04141 family sporadically distributed protein [Bacteroidia bacterium]